MGHSKRVLIIEDELDLAGILRQGLVEAGYEVDGACDGEEGLRKALAREADMIILDRKLPKLDGFSVIKSLRKKRINTPVLMLTAMEEFKDLKKAKIKADDCMTKPFRFDELLVRVSRLIALESRRELRFFEAEDGRKERLNKILS
jgi:DNA-binding response OmpR family regulator